MTYREAGAASIGRTSGDEKDGAAMSDCMASKWGARKAARSMVPSFTSAVPSAKMRRMSVMPRLPKKVRIHGAK